MSGATDYVAQADALVASDLSGAHVDVQSLAATYRSRQGDAKAHVFARALVRRAKSEGVAIPSGRGGATKADLQAEIDRRNKGRADDALIVVDAKATKADLEAALKADDERA